MRYQFRKQRCIVCGSDNAAFLGYRVPRAYDLPDELKTRVVRCRECGLIYPDPMPVPDREQWEANYGNPESYFPSKVTEERMGFCHAMLEKLEAALPTRGRLLDVGCGRGEFLLAAGDRGWVGIGVEPSPRFAEHARRAQGVDVREGGVATAGFNDASFDAATLNAVLQHAQEPRELLTSVWRVLKPGGILMVETMNHDSPVYALPDLYCRARGRAVTTHLSPTFPSFELYGFSRRPLERLLVDTGFIVDRVETRGGISKTRPVSRGIADRILRVGIKTLMVASKAAGCGQVLLALARRGG